MNTRVKNKSFTVFTPDLDKEINEKAAKVGMYNERLLNGETLSAKETEELEAHKDFIVDKLKSLVQISNKNKNLIYLSMINEDLPYLVYHNVIMGLLNYSEGKKSFFSPEKSSEFLGYLAHILKYRSNDAEDEDNSLAKKHGMTGTVYRNIKTFAALVKHFAENLKKKNPYLTDEEAKFRGEMMARDYENTRVAPIRLDAPMDDEGESPLHEGVTKTSKSIESALIKKEVLLVKLPKFLEILYNALHPIKNVGASEKTSLKIFKTNYTHELIEGVEKEKRANTIADFDDTSPLVYSLMHEKYYDNLMEEWVCFDVSSRVYKLMMLPYVAYLKVEPESYYINMECIIKADLKPEIELKDRYFHVGTFLNLSRNTIGERLDVGNAYDKWIESLKREAESY